MGKKAVKKLVKGKDWNAWCWKTKRGRLITESVHYAEPIWVWGDAGEWVKVLVVEVK